MITIFENFKNKPDANSLTPEFWEMIQIADWNKVAEGYGNFSIRQEHPDYFESAQLRLYLKYEYEEITNFLEEYYVFYTQLYDYFSNKLGKEIDEYSDEYGCFIGAIIARGKSFTQNCINNPKKYINVIDINEYGINFKDLLEIDEKEYWEIKRIDPFWGNVKKYNL